MKIKSFDCNVISIIGLVCMVIGAVVLGGLLLRISVAVLVSPIFWVIVTTVLVYKFLSKSIDKN